MSTQTTRCGGAWCIINSKQRPSALKSKRTSIGDMLTCTQLRSYLGKLQTTCHNMPRKKKKKKKKLLYLVPHLINKKKRTRTKQTTSNSFPSPHTWESTDRPSGAPTTPIDAAMTGGPDGVWAPEGVEGPKSPAVRSKGLGCGWAFLEHTL